LSIDPKRHLAEFGVANLDSGTLRNLRQIAQFRLDSDTAIRATLPDAANIATWDAAMGQDAEDNRAAIAACTDELEARGHDR